MWSITYGTTLLRAGLIVNNPRAVYGGLASDGMPVSTSWEDALMSNGRYPIWRQDRDVNGYQTLWDTGRFHVGASLRLILLRASDPLEEPRHIAMSMVMPTLWRVHTLYAQPQPGTGHMAEVEPMSVMSSLAAMIRAPEAA